METTGKLFFKLVTNFVMSGEQSNNYWWQDKRNRNCWESKQVTFSDRLLKRLQQQKKSDKTTFFTDKLMEHLNSPAKAHHPLVWIGVTLVSTLIAYRLKQRLTKRYRTAMDIPPEYYKQQRILTGRVIAVNDSDNLRIRHNSFLDYYIPFPINSKAEKLKYETINVRLAGIDAPELGHFTDKPAQPLAEEALKWLRLRTLGGTVHFQLMRLDQYSRAVCLVYTTPRPYMLFWWWRQWINVEMVRTGLACIYRLGGKEYGKLESDLEKAELEAKKRKRGMWALKNLTLPADYKKK